VRRTHPHTRPWASQATYPEPVSAAAAVRERTGKYLAPTLGAMAASTAVSALVFLALGAGAKDALLVALTVVAQGSAGAAAWSLLRGKRTVGAEIIGMGLVLGSVFSALVGVAGNAIITWQWWWAVPIPLLWIAWLVSTGGDSGIVDRRATSARTTARLMSWLPALVGVMVGLLLLALNLRRYPLTWDGVWDGYHPDMVFFEALGYSTAIFGPGDSIFMVGADIRYHWLTYAWVGQISTAVDAAPFMVLTRALPVVALVALVTLAIALVDRVGVDLPARSLSSARWLAVALIVTGGYLGAVNGTILNFDSPSQALTSAWLIGLILAVLVAVDGARVFLGYWVLIVVVAFALTGGKVSAGIVAVVAIGAVAIAGLMMKTPWRLRAVGVAFAVTVAVGAAGLVFAWGSASPGDLRFLEWSGRASTIQGLNSSPSERGVMLGTATLLLAMAARWVGGAWLLRSRSWRLRPEPWLWIGLVIAAILPVIFFAQGVNETWFALTASGPLAALAAVGMAVAWERAGLGPAAAVGAVIAGLVGVATVSYIWTDQVWESGFGRFWGPWLGAGIALLWGVLWALKVGQRPLVTALAVGCLVLTVEAAGARSTPFLGALVGGARDGAGVRAAQLAEPGLTGTSEVSAPDPAMDPETLAIPDTGDERTEPPAQERAPHAWSRDQVEAARYLRDVANREDVISTNDTEAFLVPALTRMRTFISGVPYQSLYGSAESVTQIPERIALNENILQGPARPEDICVTDASWMWLAKDRPFEVERSTLGDVSFENGAVAIIPIDRRECAS